MDDESDERNNMVKLLTKTACVNHNTKCNIKYPYSILELYGMNKATNRNYSKQERENKIKEYAELCSNNKKNTLVNCCDSKDKNLLTIDTHVDKKFKQTYPFIKVIKEKNKMKSIEVCRKSPNKCVEEGFKKPNGYEYCKLSKNTDLITNDVTNLTPDCYKFNCDEANHILFLPEANNANNTYFEDIKLFNDIRKDDDRELRAFYQSNKNNVNRILQYPNSGFPIIHRIIINNSFRCFTLSLGYNLDISIIDKYGNTPLHMACLLGNAVMVFMLIKQGSDLYSTNNFGDTPLHCAIISGNEGLMPMLINNGSSIHEKNNNGDTPLFTAVTCRNKNLKIINLLIQTGADITVRNKKNETMLEVLNKKNIKNDQISLEIDTLLRNLYYKRSKSHQEYLNLIQSNKLISPYIIGDEQDDIDVEVEYSDDRDTVVYYDDMDIPIKKNYYLKENFNNMNNNSISNNQKFFIFVTLSIVIIFLIKLSIHS